jgi:S-adenosylmethionine decarboxylase proenzyme
MKWFVKSWLLLFCFMFTQVKAEFENTWTEKSEDPIYEFVGYHLIASYLECDLQKLSDLNALKETMQRAVEASGATILEQVDYVFPPNGLTMVFLLSESHASIHTYPEHGACFVDFFTCGRRCSSENFNTVLKEYLCPKTANCSLLYRDQHTTIVNQN